MLRVTLSAFLLAALLPAMPTASADACAGGFCLEDCGATLRLHEATLFCTVAHNPHEVGADACMDAFCEGNVVVSCSFLPRLFDACVGQPLRECVLLGNDMEHENWLCVGGEGPCPVYVEKRSGGPGGAQRCVVVLDPR